MRISLTFSIYLTRQILSWLGVVFFGLTCLLFIFDVVEQLRRAAKKSEAGIVIVLQMSALQLPHLIEQTLPFIVLFGSMMAFWRLSRSNELVIARAAGVSAWQFLLPALALAAALGTFQITAFNPLASSMLAHYERLDARYMQRTTSRLVVSPTGLWLRQGDENGQTVINAQRITSDEVDLTTVIFFLFENPDRFVSRIDAQRAQLRDGYWNIENAWLSAPDKPIRFVETYALPTDLTPDRVRNSFASPETMSFWDIPDFLETLEAAGFSGHRHRLYWHRLLATPLLLCAMVLIAAVFSLRISGRMGAARTIGAGVVCSFILYFLSDIVYALGLSATIPPVLSAWTPAGVTTLLGLATVFHLEDG